MKRFKKAARFVGRFVVFIIPASIGILSLIIAAVFLLIAAGMCAVMGLMEDARDLIDLITPLVVSTLNYPPGVR